MNFIYSLHIEHFIGMEIFLAIRHVVMFMRDEDVPTCKLSKLGDPLGEEGGGGGGVKLAFAKWEVVAK